MKCKIKQCKACCCYNIPLADNELERFADKIVNPVTEVVPLGDAVVAFTAPVQDSIDLMANALRNNKCPFLRKDYRCNIYENRPKVCRLMAEIPEMPCEFRK